MYQCGVGAWRAGHGIEIPCWAPMRVDEIRFADCIPLACRMLPAPPPPVCGADFARRQPVQARISIRDPIPPGPPPRTSTYQRLWMMFGTYREGHESLPRV